MKEGNFCCHKTTERSEKEYKSLMNRLSRIEGQIRGIKGMVETERVLHGHTDPGGGSQCSTQFI